MPRRMLGFHRRPRIACESSGESQAYRNHCSSKEREGSGIRRVSPTRVSEVRFLPRSLPIGGRSSDRTERRLWPGGRWFESSRPPYKMKGEKHGSKYNSFNRDSYHSCMEFEGFDRFSCFSCTSRHLSSVWVCGLRTLPGREKRCIVVETSIIFEI